MYCQTLTPKQAENFRWNIFDVTKVWPHSEVPLRRIGKLSLNRNPTNYFAEIEQVAFSPAHLVPGIEPSADPMLQARLFSDNCRIPSRQVRHDGTAHREIRRGKVGHGTRALHDSEEAVELVPEGSGTAGDWRRRLSRDTERRMTEVPEADQFSGCSCSASTATPRVTNEE